MTSLVILPHYGALTSEHRRIVGASNALPGEAEVLLLGPASETLSAEVARLTGVSRVWHWALAQEAIAYQAKGLAGWCRECGVSHVLAPSSGQDLLARMAALLDVDMLTDVMAIESADTFVRAQWADSLHYRIQSLEDIKVMTLRPGGFAPAAERAEAVLVAKLPLESASSPVTLVAPAEPRSDRPELTSAARVVVAGRGLADPAAMDQLAQRLDAALGGTRAAVDAGLLGNECQVGQTGAVIAPDLYLGLGASGAIQHLAGIQGAKTVIAVDKDPDTPLMQIADYRLVGDLDQVLPRLLELLAAHSTTTPAGG